MGSGEPQWPATVEGRRTHSQTYVFKLLLEQIVGDVSFLGAEDLT